MTFFDKKEDVIGIELTPHGRKLLSQGKLNPHYYAFYDDDILYDSTKGGFSETNSQTKSRILSETIYMRPQTNYQGVESSLSDQKLFNSQNYMLSPIGSNRIENHKSNGWKVNFLHNTASSTLNTLSSSTQTELQIPQINSTIEYELAVKQIPYEPFTTQPILREARIGNSLYVDLTEEQLLINIMEENGFTHSDALEVEVYLFEQDQQSFKRLKFDRQEDQVVDDTLQELDEQYSLRKSFTRDIGPEKVEYWIRLLFDDGVPPSDLCSGIQNLQLHDIYLDLEVECPDVKPGSPANIYATTAEDLEECEE